MINKEQYYKEVDDILKNNKNLNKKDFDILLDMANTQKEGTDVSRTIVCNEIIKKLFGFLYSKETLIPWTFFNSEVGKVIIKVKYGEENTDIYFVRDISVIMGRTKQYINQEIKAGNLKGYKRDGKVIVYRKDLEDYLNRRGFDRKVYEEKMESILVPNDRDERYGEE